MDFRELQAQVVNNSSAVYGQIVSWLPKIITGLIILLVGFFVAVTLKKVTAKILRKMKVNTIVSKTNLDEQLKDAGVKMDLVSFFSNFVKWVVYIITFLLITDIFNLTIVTAFLYKILGVLGKIILGLVVFAITVYVARFADAIAKAIANYIDIKNSKLVGKIVTIVVYFVGLSIFADILNITILSEITSALVSGMVFGTSIAFGIAFGIGGQDKAKEIINNIKK